jgi:hypothetical protein
MYMDLADQLGEQGGRKQERGPLRFFRDDALGNLQSQAFAEDAVGKRREVRTMLLEHAALEEDHRLVTIEGANLARIQIADPDHLRRSARSNEDHREEEGKVSKLHISRSSIRGSPIPIWPVRLHT